MPTLVERPGEPLEAPCVIFYSSFGRSGTSLEPESVFLLKVSCSILSSTNLWGLL